MRWEWFELNKKYNVWKFKFWFDWLRYFIADYIFLCLIYFRFFDFVKVRDKSIDLAISRVQISNLYFLVRSNFLDYIFESLNFMIASRESRILSWNHNLICFLTMLIRQRWKDDENLLWKLNVSIDAHSVETDQSKSIQKLNNRTRVTLNFKWLRSLKFWIFDVCNCWISQFSI